MMLQGETINEPQGEIKVSFEYHCTTKNDDSLDQSPNYIDIPSSPHELIRASSSFSCLLGAALSANATLANTNICNGLIGSEILPTLDSPNSFRKIPSSTKLDFFLSSSLPSSMSSLSFSPSSLSDYDSISLKSMSDPYRNDSFLNLNEVQIAGGPAGEDRVQAVCSEENGWLFCSIYDGFNGRDGADFLAGTLYETVACHLNLFDFQNMDGFVKQGVLSRLQHALDQTENEFLHMVEQEMDERPDLVSIGSCVLLVLLHGKNLYVLNLGDSRAVLATYGRGSEEIDGWELKAVQLTDNHTVDCEAERIRVLNEHLDDPSVVVGGKVKGKLKVTRAFGVGYLKKKCMNDALMGILRVQNLISPPYVSTQPSLRAHEVSNLDHFVVLGSDGLFDFFTNDEVVKLVNSYILRNPFGDPAKFLVEQLAARAADSAGFSMEELMSIPAGRRRKYHDDVTVIVIVLGSNKRTSKASTCL
ncbi:protein phosphatase 2C family protein [Striga asiatica]|uniref:Protein phosphatase 2C family protein n=1 Tax=Striga asiatica TaxID=4170 RepID=A0A5A7R494_STRAF|nr:protein phosphatase 2C family protein [Striga asiatica]